jgi:hypothetical protein
MVHGATAAIEHGRPFSHSIGPTRLKMRKKSRTLWLTPVESEVSKII